MRGHRESGVWWGVRRWPADVLCANRLKQWLKVYLRALGSGGESGGT